MMKLFSLALTMLLCSLALTACQPSSEGSADLRDFVEQVKNKPPRLIEPLPTFKAVSPFSYSASKKRDPFTALSSQHFAQRDLHRAKEPLENFPLESLRMIGILLEQGKRWALILAPNGRTYEVTIGSFIGQNDGQVQKVTKDKVSMTEAVLSTGGWKNRTVELKLNSIGGEKSI